MGRKLGKGKPDDRHLTSEIERLGSTLKQKRLEMGLTQEQVAEKLGSTTEAVRFIENAYRSASLKTLIKLSDKLGLRVELRPKK